MITGSDTNVSALGMPVHDCRRVFCDGSDAAEVLVTATDIDLRLPIQGPASRACPLFGQRWRARILELSILPLSVNIIAIVFMRQPRADTDQQDSCK